MTEKNPQGESILKSYITDEDNEIGDMDQHEREELERRQRIKKNWN